MRATEVRSALASLGVVPSKGRGQNFLIDERIADREVELLGPSSSDAILEVGPGLGILTERLVGKVRVLQAIELDERMAGYLEERFGDDLKLIRGDALELPWPSFDKFISNVPYSISSPLLFRLLEHDFHMGVVMVQKEFADRMVAEPDSDDYSRLTVNLYYRAECEMVERVSHVKFWPEPEVDSAIVVMRPRLPPFHVEDERLFFNLVDRLFQQRRKKIGTVLKRSGLIDPSSVPELPYVDDRVEALSPEQIGELADAIVARRTKQ